VREKRSVRTVTVYTDCPGCTSKVSTESNNKETIILGNLVINFVATRKMISGKKRWKNMKNPYK
jgi:hypothetical protein